LNSHREEIVAMLGELPTAFKRSAGGGHSFLEACNDKYGNQWTGFHTNMEQLFQLGIAIGMVECQVPPELWPALPGGKPYYVVNM